MNWFTPLVLISALGYFVDIFDLVLFSIVRIPSLKTLNIPEDQIFSASMTLLNLQMIGMFLGGIIWGIIGDKKGRLTVLFASIFLYSAANMANAFVDNIQIYYILRFIAGFGLAGELGAAVTLVCESLPTEKRGMGTTMVATLGIMGGIAAALISSVLPWQHTYFIGGALGFLLLILRMRVYESSMFLNMQAEQRNTWNDLKKLITSGTHRRLFILCVCSGLPIWFIAGICTTFSPEIANSLGVQGKIESGTAVMISYFGAVAGDLGSGLLSQWLHSRQKAIRVFLILIAVSALVYLNGSGLPPAFYYTMIFLLGIGGGYWAVFITTASEYFGTNLRATVTSAAPNFVRAAVVPMTFILHFLNQKLNFHQSAMVIGAVVLLIAFIANAKLPETFSKNLDYVE